MSKNRISRCLWLQAKLRLDSPAAIGSGNASHTDRDLLTGNDGRPFLPGASIAGIARSLLLADNGEMQQIFGGEKEESTQSIVTFWDGTIPEDEPFTISFRDGVAINERTKTAADQSKYDFEVLNPGTCFRLRMEVVVREEQKELPYQQFVSNFLACIRSGDFRIGGKTMRGYGKVSLEDVRIMKKTFDGDDAADFLDYVNFDWEELKKGGEEKLPKPTYRSPYTDLELLLRPESTLLIRNYFVQNMGADCEQLQTNGKTVIPGTAWAGLFRHKVTELLEECMDDETQAKGMIEKLFGPEKKSDERWRARILFEESMNVDVKPEEQSELRLIMRNKIDRFTGGVLKSALFSERVAVGGAFRLGIRIRDAKDYEIGMVLLAAEEVCSSLAAIGGATAVGRGVLKPGGAVRMRTPVMQNQEASGDEEKQAYRKVLDDEKKQAYRQAPDDEKKQVCQEALDDERRQTCGEAPDNEKKQACWEALDDERKQAYWDALDAEITRRKEWGSVWSATE